MLVICFYELKYSTYICCLTLNHVIIRSQEHTQLKFSKSDFWWWNEVERLGNGSDKIENFDISFFENKSTENNCPFPKGVFLCCYKDKITFTGFFVAIFISRTYVYEKLILSSYFVGST